ncbi:MAG: hypothetical protein Q9202_000862 [Teloschistes flavicans]
MGKIKSIEYFRVLPRWLFVKITDEHDNYGWGEATLEGHSQAVEGCLDAMIQRFVGYEADNIEHLWQTAHRHSFYRGGPVLMSALAGIDIALWDLLSRRLNLPLHVLLGGAVRHKVKVYSWIGGDRPRDVEAAAKERYGQGFRAVKMNATEDVDWLDSPNALETSVERCRIVKSVGLDVGLDFHGRLHKPMAKQLAKALEPHKPLFIEEPLLSEHHEGIKQLSGLTTIPIALGERLYSRWDVKRFLHDTSIDILQPDISHCGGISEIRRIASMAEAYDVALAPHCPLGPIALAACIQVAMCTPNFTIQEMGLTIHYNTEHEGGAYDIKNYIKDAGVWDVREGYVEGLKGPGLGVEVDEEEVRRVAKTANAWPPKGFVGPDGSIREW